MLENVSWSFLSVTSYSKRVNWKGCWGEVELMGCMGSLDSVCHCILKYFSPHISLLLGKWLGDRRRTPDCDSHCTVGVLWMIETQEFPCLCPSSGSGAWGRSNRLSVNRQVKLRYWNLRKSWASRNTRRWIYVCIHINADCKHQDRKVSENSSIDQGQACTYSELTTGQTSCLKQWNSFSVLAASCRHRPHFLPTFVSLPRLKPM